MSNNGYGFTSIYVRELDSYISIDNNPFADEEWDARVLREQKEQEELHEKFRSIGAVNLFAGETLVPSKLIEFGISPERWQWGVYQAERRLLHYEHWTRLEPLLVRQLHSLGRAYAIRRYAKFEKLHVATATAAALPYGINALFHQYFESEGLQATPSLAQRINVVLRECLGNPDATAYSKTARVQEEIHAIARCAWGEAGPITISRKRTREILSLTRLHYSIAETKSGGLGRLGQLKNMYDAERERLSRGGPLVLHPFARVVRDWHRQHVWPLTAYYPISIRDAFDRGSREVEIGGGRSERVVWVNELALAYCSTSRIEEIARSQSQKWPKRIKS